MPRPHACLRAYFDVLADIRSDYRYGVFSEPGRRYKTWVRFSNGHYDLKTSQDYENDARGMALKLMEIDRQPLEQSDAGNVTQDFLMANTPVFFVRNMPDYNFFVANPENLKAFFFPDWNPFNWRIRELFAGKRVLSPPPASVLDPVYYSITPYKLGPRNIKFAARPCNRRGDTVPVADEQGGADFLREQLREELGVTAGPASSSRCRYNRQIKAAWTLMTRPRSGPNRMPPLPRWPRLLFRNRISQALNRPNSARTCLLRHGTPCPNTVRSVS